MGEGLTGEWGGVGSQSVIPFMVRVGSLLTPARVFAKQTGSDACSPSTGPEDWGMEGKDGSSPRDAHLAGAHR